MSQQVSRRTLAKGAAWAAPVVAASSVIPAYAASRNPSVGGTICSLFYAQGASVNYQGHQVYLGVTSSDGTLPAGTTITWNFSMSGGSYMRVPTTNYSANSVWSLTTSPARGTQTSNFTVTLTINQSTTTSALNCVPSLIWTDGTAWSLSPETTITMNSVASGNVNPVPSGLSWKVAKRYPDSVNSSGRRAHRYISKSGDQACYPTIRYVTSNNTSSSAMACGDNGNSTSTIYPDGTCARVTTTTGQSNVPEKC